MSAEKRTVIDIARAKAIKAWNAEALVLPVRTLTGDEVLDIILKTVAPVFRDDALDEAAKALESWGDTFDVREPYEEVLQQNMAYEAAVVVQRMKDGTE